MNELKRNGERSSTNLKLVIKNLFIVFAVDVITSAGVLFLMRPTEAYLPLEWWLLLACFVINACLSVAVRHFMKKLSKTLAINSIISPLVFHFVLMLSLSW